MGSRLGDAALPAGREVSDRAEARRLRGGIRALLGCFAATEREDVTACRGITPAQAATLTTLRRAGPLRLGALATHLRVRPSTLTRNVRRIEEHWLIGRLRDSGDARAERVSFTAVAAATARSFETLEEDLALDVLRRIPAGRRASAVAPRLPAAADADPRRLRREEGGGHQLLRRHAAVLLRAPPHLHTARFDLSLTVALLVVGVAGSYGGARLASLRVSSARMKQIFGVLIVVVTSYKLYTLLP